MPKPPNKAAGQLHHSIKDAERLTGFERKIIMLRAKGAGALSQRPVQTSILWGGKPKTVMKRQYFVDADFVRSLAVEREGVKEFDEKTETTKKVFLEDQGVWYENKLTKAKKEIIGGIKWEKRIIRGKRGPNIVYALPDAEIKKIEQKLKEAGLYKIHVHNMYSWPKFLAMFFGAVPSREKTERFDFLKKMVKWRIYRSGYGKGGKAPIEKQGNIEYLLPDDPQIKVLEEAAWRLKKAVKKSMPAAELARLLGKNNAYVTAAIKHGFILKNVPEGPYNSDRVIEFGGRYYINRDYALKNKEMLDKLLEKAASFDSSLRIKQKRDGVLQEYAGMAEVGNTMGIEMARAAAYKFRLGEFLKGKLGDEVITHKGKHYLSRKFFEHPENITRLRVIVGRRLRELGLPKLGAESAATKAGGRKISQPPPKTGQVSYRWNRQQLEIKQKFANLVAGMQRSFGLPQQVVDNYTASWTPGKIQAEHAKIMGLQYEYNLQKTTEDKEWYRKRIIDAISGSRAD
ncbi:MAG: hypothetical protein V1676_01355 [Candidatus Diapherotrites archaeon]